MYAFPIIRRLHHDNLSIPLNLKRHSRKKKTTLVTMFIVSLWRSIWFENFSVFKDSKVAKRAIWFKNCVKVVGVRKHLNKFGWIYSNVFLLCQS